MQTMIITSHFATAQRPHSQHHPLLTTPRPDTLTLQPFTTLRHHTVHTRPNTVCHALPFTPDVANVFSSAWGTSASTLAATITPQIFAFSIFPYAAFLYYLTRSGKTPPMALFGFYFLLAFVFVTIPAGIYAKKEFGTTLANVDWLHGGAESLLTVTNLLIVLGFRKAILEEQEKKQKQQQSAVDAQEAGQEAAALADKTAATRES